jgi:hypothetical protein
MIWTASFRGVQPTAAIAIVWAYTKAEAIALLNKGLAEQGFEDCLREGSVASMQDNFQILCDGGY